MIEYNSVPFYKQMQRATSDDTWIEVVARHVLHRRSCTSVWEEAPKEYWRDPNKQAKRWVQKCYWEGAPSTDTPMGTRFGIWIYKDEDGPYFYQMWAADEIIMEFNNDANPETICFNLTMSDLYDWSKIPPNVKRINGWEMI